MSNRLIPCILSVLIITAQSLFSATFPVSGRILNRSGNPIANANVSLKVSGEETTTNNDGYFGELTPVTNILSLSNQTTISLNSKSIKVLNMRPNIDIHLILNDLRGRKIIKKTLKSDFRGVIKSTIISNSEKIADGLYIISIKSDDINLSLKSIIKDHSFTSMSTQRNSYIKENRSNRARAIDTISISHSNYQNIDMAINSYDENIEITLDPTGPEDIPILYPDVSGKIYIRNSMGNITDTLKAYSVMPPAGIQEWSEVVDGRDPTGVVYDSILTTSTTMKAHMIRAGMLDENDWQSSFATAIIGSNPFKDLSHIVIRYMVESNLDSIALSLNAVNGSDVIAESMDHGAFRKVLTKGVANPGQFVTDTLSMSDFTIAWADDASLKGISLVDHLDSLDNYEAIAFTNELLPWDYNTGAPVNDGDTINITVAGILFGTKWDTVINDTIIDTTITDKYPLHKNIMSSTFWCGEGASGDNDFITNTTSAWDAYWGQRFGIEDGPFLQRDANFIPTSSKYSGDENPYYFALPYNDMGPGVYDGSGPDDNSAPIDGYWRKENSYNVVYWADEKSASEWGSKTSMCKNRWIKVSVAGTTDKYCYAQWEDAGPYYYNDHTYVWGSSKPANTTDSPYSGIDLSPSVCLYLGQSMQDWGAPSFEVDWCFVDEADVPDGPWKLHVTTIQINW